MTAPNRLALIPGYLEAKRRVEIAREAYVKAGNEARAARSLVSQATIAEAGHQVGRILTWPTGRRAKIVQVNSHHLNASLAYPVIAYELGKLDTWSKQPVHLYTHIFNFELGVWETGTVDCDGDFHPKGGAAADAEQVNG